jgi:hypothetical protein
MTPQNFIEIKLSALAKQFPHVCIRYGYDEIGQAHIVELTPANEYYSNIELDNSWMPISWEFYDLFENEDLTFITDDSWLKIENVILEFNLIKSLDECIISDLFAPIMQNFIAYSFSTKIPAGQIMKNSIGKFLSYPLQDMSEEGIVESSYSIAA